MKLTQEVWSHVFRAHMKVSLKKSTGEFHLKLDWSHLGVGYVLYTGEPIYGLVVGLVSKGAMNDPFSSYMGEFSGVVWTLEDTKENIQC